MSEAVSSPGLSLERQVIHRGYDRRSCWVHARCGFIPGDTVIVTLQRCLMGETEAVWDLFEGISTMRSDDGGKTWSAPKNEPTLQRWTEPEGVEVAVSDFTPKWHEGTGRLIGVGHTCRYQGGRLMAPPRPRQTVVSVFDHAKNAWGPVQLLEMPEGDRFFSAGAGSIQWEEMPGGDLLLPIYFTSRPESTPATGQMARSSVVVLRCRFEGNGEKGGDGGEVLRVQEIGGEVTLPVHRGLGEPSLIFFGGRYWLTLRSGLRAYRATSRDGLHFEAPEPWRFDDGEELGSYDTQAHWAQAGGRLYLVYTRRGVDNAHVVRHRAPLFVAEVDVERGVLLRESEQIAIPNRGAQLGNFGVGQVNAEEAWICASEWMENAGEWNPEVWGALETLYPKADLHQLASLPGRCGLCELSGSDNSVHLVRLR